MSKRRGICVPQTLTGNDLFEIEQSDWPKGGAEVYHGPLLVYHGTLLRLTSWSGGSVISDQR